MSGYRIDERGRWGGRLTSRPLPDGDAAIDALTDVERAHLVEVWLGRAATERRVADSFAVILDALGALGGQADAIRLSRRAIDDEYRHAEICRFVASKYRGAELPPPAELPLTVPKLAQASEVLRHTLHIVGQCVLNETTASAFLTACIDGADGPLARAALRELLSDEVDHARIGWIHLATVSPATRAELAPWLLPMARQNIKMWRESSRPYGPEHVYAVHGAPTEEAVEVSLRGALAELIIPGFALLGVPTDELAGWLAAGAPSV